MCNTFQCDFLIVLLFFNLPPRARETIISVQFLFFCDRYHDRNIPSNAELLTLCENIRDLQMWGDIYGDDLWFDCEMLDSRNRKERVTSVVDSMDAPCFSRSSTTLMRFFLQAIWRGVKPFRALAFGSAFRSSSNLATLTWPQWAATWSEVR